MEAVAGRSSGVLDRVVALACRITGVDEAVVLLRGRGRSGSLTAVASHGGPAASPAAWPSGEGAIRRALVGGLPAVEEGDGPRLSAAAPLMVAGEARGVLAVLGGEPSTPFGPEQLEMLAELAELGAGSLRERDLRARAEAIIDAGVDVLARAVDRRDDYAGRHSAQVGRLARRVGKRLGMAGGELDRLDCAARLHDVGKLGVPDAVLQKPGPLNEREWAVMRHHPEWGAEMVGRVPGLEDVAELVGAHHERWDGDGYPHGLAGEGIPLASRVLSACDAFEAMVSRRPYRAPLSVATALGELAAGAGSQFDPDVVTALRAVA
jgi:hypothetical protein